MAAALVLLVAAYALLVLLPLDKIARQVGAALWDGGASKS